MDNNKHCSVIPKVGPPETRIVLLSLRYNLRSLVVKTISPVKSVWTLTIAINAALEHDFVL